MTFSSITFILSKETITNIWYREQLRGNVNITLPVHSNEKIILQKKPFKMSFNICFVTIGLQTMQWYIFVN